MTLSLGKVLRRESRRDPRVKEKLNIVWQSHDKAVNGAGRIRNISASGMLLEANSKTELADNAVLAFTLPEKIQGYPLPLMGRLVWSRSRQNLGSISSLLGIEFIEPAQETIAQLRQKIENTIAKIESAQRAKNITGFILALIMVALIGFALFQQALLQRSYEESTSQLLQTSTKQASLYTTVSQDLKATKVTLAQTQAVLTQTETLLTQAREENQSLQNELQTVRNNLELLTAENARLSKETENLKERLKPFEGEIATIEEGRSSTKLVRKRLRDIKIGIHGLKKQAQLAMIAAQKERDKLLLAQGNQGYVVKDGKSLTATANSPQEQAQPKKKININVSFFE